MRGGDLEEKMRRPICTGLILALSLTLVLPLSGCTKKAEVIKAEGGLLVQTTKEDFNKGEWKDAAISKQGDGEIQIGRKFGKYAKTATYTSAEIDKDFTSVILSFNADTPQGTSVIVEQQLKVGDTWSGWFNYANWGKSVRQGSAINNEEDPLAYIDVDAMVVKDMAKPANAARYRITLSTNDEKVTPSVKLMSLSFENEAVEASAAVSGNTIKLDKVLDVPAFSQMERDPEIANSICSATSLTMVMRYHGLELLPEETAWGAYDNNALMFGNWVFNCAFAGSKGFDAYVAYLDTLDDLKREIQNGCPVVCSVRYKASEEVGGDLPIVHGAAIASTPGHLLVVCGFTEENGKEYVVVNDPAAGSSDGVRLKYLAEEFEKAWVKVSYIVHKKEGQQLDVKRVSGVLEATGNTKQYVSSIRREYVLKVDGKKVDIGEKNVKLIMATLDGKNYLYLSPSRDSDAMMFTGRDKKGVYKFYIITANGITYTADLDWQG
jgi:hypothetical protein